MSISDYEPADQGSKDENVIWDEEKRDRMKRIIYIVGKKKASYPSEIAKFMSIEPSEVAGLVHQLIEEGHLERLKPQMSAGGGDERLLARRNELFAQSKYGLDTWRNMTWVGLDMDKILTLNDGRVVDPKGNPVDKEDDFDEVKSCLGIDKTVA